jgi:hypothetical protein
VQGLALPERVFPCATPAEVRATLPRDMDVLAFQCRNPIHRAHYELFTRALDAPNVGEGAVCLVHPTCGPTQVCACTCARVCACVRWEGALGGSPNSPVLAAGAEGASNNARAPCCAAASLALLCVIVSRQPRTHTHTLHTHTTTNTIIAG